MFIFPGLTWTWAEEHHQYWVPSHGSQACERIVCSKNCLRWFNLQALVCSHSSTLHFSAIYSSEFRRMLPTCFKCLSSRIDLKRDSKRPKLMQFALMPGLSWHPQKERITKPLFSTPAGRKSQHRDCLGFLSLRICVRPLPHHPQSPFSKHNNVTPDCMLSNLGEELKVKQN